MSEIQSERQPLDPSGLRLDTGPKDARTTDWPLASVVVVNLNGQALLAECLDSLIAQDYPEKRVEIILVDNASTDNSVPFVNENYPAVHIVQAGRNLGFAGGSNLGARVATGDYLAFLNNDARVDSHWIVAMVEALEQDAEAVCAASKILDYGGEKIDFVATAMNLYGRAFQIDKGLPVASGFHDSPRELLAPCGGAMMIARDLFWKIGGFDEDYFAYFEDVDLGWRLWLYGHKVVFVPQAIAYHRQHQTGSVFPVEQRYVLSEMNALRTLIKNLQDENLWRILPFSLFMAVKRSVHQAGLDREPYQIGYAASGDSQAGVLEPEPHMTRVATSFLVAIDQVAEEMSSLMEKRRRIQAARVRTDAEIFAKFPMHPWNPIFPWRRYHVAQDQLAESLGMTDIMRPRHGSQLLIITHETIGPKMAGPGIRAWELACALSQSFAVTLAAPGTPVRSHPGVRVVGYETEDSHYASLTPYLTNTDVILVMGTLLATIPALQDLGKPTIVDLYDPFELEKLTQSPSVDKQYHLGIDLESVAHLHLEGTAGDFYICASERQRDFWLGTLLACGRVNTVTYAHDPTLRALIDVVPFGIPAQPPRKQRAVLKGVHPGISADDRLLLWNGGLWQWFDPLTLIGALVQVLAVRDDVKLFFAAGKHFDPGTVPEMPIYAQAVDHCRQLGLLNRYVFFGDWIPYDERGDYLLEADLGVSIHQSTVESHFASRTRLLDCIWAELPVVTTAGDPLSDLIAELGLGRTVSTGRTDVLAKAILDMLADENLRDRVTRQARKVRDEYTWSRCVKPIASFLERASFAPDALDATRVAAKTRQMSFHLRHLQHRIEALEQEKQSLREQQQDMTAAWTHEKQELIKAQQDMMQDTERDRQDMLQEKEDMIAAWERERQDMLRERENMSTAWEQERQTREERIQQLEAHIEAIAQGRVMRLLNALSGRKR